MNEKNSRELIECYPEMFSDLNPKCPMAMFYFECGDGWFDLLKDCILDIKKICQEKGLNPKTFQIKEKYGSLRFYVDGADCCIFETIEKASDLSAITCEACGSNAEKRMRGRWVSTQCDKCWQLDCERYPQDIK